MRFIVCPDCGDKRCPRATDHRNACAEKKIELDPITEAVRADLLRRSQVGIAKYGVTLARTDLTLRDWLQHTYEECIDQAQYLKRAIVDLDRGKQ